MSDEIAKDEFGRYVRVKSRRGGYIVCERIDKYGRRNGGMAMYYYLELRPAKLAKRTARKKAARAKTK